MFIQLSRQYFMPMSMALATSMSMSMAMSMAGTGRKALRDLVIYDLYGGDISQ
jgi:hypothetical protein